MLHLSKQHIKIFIIITNRAEYNIGVINNYSLIYILCRNYIIYFQLHILINIYIVYIHIYKYHGITISYKNHFNHLYYIHFINYKAYHI